MWRLSLFAGWTLVPPADGVNSHEALVLQLPGADFPDLGSFPGTKSHCAHGHSLSQRCACVVSPPGRGYPVALQSLVSAT